MSLKWNTKGQGLQTAEILLVCCLILCGLSSCSSVEKGSSEKILSPVGANKDVIVVDFYRVRLRYEQRQLLEDFWNDDGTTDQVIPVDLRRCLANEGIRIGVQGRTLSPTLARLLELDKVRLDESIGRITERTTDKQQTDITEFSSEEMLLEPLVNYQLLTLFPGKRWNVNTYDDPLPQAVLFWNQGGWCGKTYPKAQGIIGLSAITYPDGSGIRFDLLPVLEYGDPKQSSRFINGGYIPDVSRDKLPYDSLKISIKLLPGQWLVVGPTGPNPPGLGKPFFTRDNGRAEQKIMVFRLKDNI